MEVGDSVWVARPDDPAGPPRAAAGLVRRRRAAAALGRGRHAARRDERVTRRVLTRVPG